MLTQETQLSCRLQKPRAAHITLKEFGNVYEKVSQTELQTYVAFFKVKFPIHRLYFVLFRRYRLTIVG